MARYEKVTAIVFYRRVLTGVKNLFGDTIGKNMCRYYISYVAIRCRNGHLKVLLDLRTERTGALEIGYDADDMTDFVVHLANRSHYSIGYWYNMGRTYYDIIYIDQNNPTHAEHFACRLPNDML